MELVSASNAGHDDLSARSSQRPSVVVADTAFDIEAGQAKEQFHLARVVDVTVEIADIAMHLPAVGKLVVHEADRSALLVRKVLSGLVAEKPFPGHRILGVDID